MILLLLLRWIYREDFLTPIQLSLKQVIPFLMEDEG